MAATLGTGVLRLSLAILLFCAAWSGQASAADVVLTTSDPANYNLHVVSYTEIPFRTVIHQQYDYSCGSAALATLLRFHYGYDTNEAKVFKAMFAVGDQARIKKLGFSLLDMKKYLAALGYQADGYRFNLTDLAQANSPAIALVQVGTYKHFVVVKGIANGQVLVGDPALGLREISADAFQKIWNGIAFLIHDAPATAQPAVFNSKDEWKRWMDFHPLSAAVINPPLAPFSRDLYVLYQIEPNQLLPSPFQP